MASEIPTPLLLIVLSAVESVVGTYAVPQYLPPNPFNWLFVRFAIVQIGLWSTWAVFIYPFFFSPFLDLPRPKVTFTMKQQVALELTVVGRPPNFRSWRGHVQ